MIEKHPNPRDIYSEKLAGLGVMTEEESKNEVKEFDQFLESKYRESEKIDKVKIRKFLINEYKSYQLPLKDEFNPRLKPVFLPVYCSKLQGK